MVKLTIVAGPNRGATYTLQEGETSVGRNSQNVIVIPSSKVSKRHCVLQVNGGEVSVVDQGSSNGTFVNGVLSKSKDLNGGDRISVGDCVFQVVKPGAAQPVGPPGGAGGFDNVVSFPGGGTNGGGVPGMPMGGVPGNAAPDFNAGFDPAQASAQPNMAESVDEDPTPTDLKGKVFWLFERFVMPTFYSINFKNEWRIVTAALFGVFVLVSLVISVYPLIEANNRTIRIETARRAQLMARQLVDLNSAAMRAKAETKTTIGNLGREPGTVAVLLTDLDSRVIAPANQSNQYLAGGPVASKVVASANLFKQGRETGTVGVAGNTVVAVEPVKVFNPRQGRNIVVAMAVAALDTSISTPDLGSIGIIYSKALIMTGVLGLFLLLVLYRLTVKPFEVLGEDIDKVLTGDLGQVTREFKMEETRPLYDLIDSALHRIPKEGDEGEMGGGLNAEDFVTAARTLGDVAAYGLVLCDESRNVLYVNEAFEDISGIRNDEAAGHDLGSVARDQAFAALVSDLFDSVQMGGGSTGDDFEFGGIPYRMHAVSFGNGSAKGYLLAAVRSEE